MTIHAHPRTDGRPLQVLRARLSSSPDFGENTDNRIRSVIYQGAFVGHVGVGEGVGVGAIAASAAVGVVSGVDCTDTLQHALGFEELRSPECCSRGGHVTLRYHRYVALT